MDRGLLRDEDWRPLDGEMCRVIEFTPLSGSVEGGEVKSSSKGLPYASIEIEAPPLPEPTTGFVTHKIDFLHLWEVFQVRGVADDEEVIVIWNKSALRGVHRWLSRIMPGLMVWVCRKHTYDLLHDPNFRPEIETSARYDHASPIAKWEPDVLQ
jgi:hypothetical protein